jgi:hypothetical protein
MPLESREGFPERVRRTSLGDARWKIALRFVRRYSSAQSPGSIPQRAAVARLAGGDRAVDLRGSARMRLCGELASPRPVFGADRNASSRRGSTDCSATRRVPRASSRCRRGGRARHFRRHNHRMDSLYNCVRPTFLVCGVSSFSLDGLRSMGCARMGFAERKVKKAQR